MSRIRRLAALLAVAMLATFLASCSSSTASQQQSSSAASLPYANAAAEYEANDAVIEAEAAFKSCLDIDSSNYMDTHDKHARIVYAKQRLDGIIRPEGLQQAHSYLKTAVESMCDYADIELAVAQGKYQEYQVTKDAINALKKANDAHTQYFNEMMRLKYGK